MFNSFSNQIDDQAISRLSRPQIITTPGNLNFVMRFLKQLLYSARLKSK